MNCNELGFGIAVSAVHWQAFLIGSFKIQHLEFKTHPLLRTEGGRLPISLYPFLLYW